MGAQQGDYWRHPYAWPATLLVVFALFGASELDRAADFRERSGAQSTIEGNSKLSRAVSPLEALGPWPDSVG